MSLASSWNFLKKHTPLHDGQVTAQDSMAQHTAPVAANADFQATEFLADDEEPGWSDTVVVQDYVDTEPSGLHPL